MCLPAGREAFHLHLKAGVRQLAFYNTVFHISRKQRARNALGVGQRREQGKSHPLSTRLRSPHVSADQGKVQRRRQEQSLGRTGRHFDFLGHPAIQPALHYEGTLCTLLRCIFLTMTA